MLIVFNASISCYFLYDYGEQKPRKHLHIMSQMSKEIVVRKLWGKGFRINYQSGAKQPFF